MIINRIPRAHTAGHGGAFNYTEVNMTVFNLITSASWVNYDIHTNNGIPKGAVVDLLVCNINTTSAKIGGARNDGSSIDRKINIVKAEKGGYAPSRMLVTCHATTGLIECYVEITSDIRFKIMGYWEGAEFTERFDSVSVLSTTDNMWTDINLNTLFSTPVSRVYDIAKFMDGNVQRNMGVRVNGSALDRKLDQMEDDGSTGGSVLNNFVKIDASGIYETFIELYGDGKNYIMGYWDDTVDFEERWDLIPPSGDATWTDKDLTAYVTDPLFSEITMVIKVLGGLDLGARKKGNSDSRLISITHVFASGTMCVGYAMTCNLDADEIVQVYAEDMSNSSIYHSGYFK